MDLSWEEKNRTPPAMDKKNAILRCAPPGHMDVSENSGTPKSSILIGFSIINHPFLETSISFPKNTFCVDDVPGYDPWNLL